MSGEGVRGSVALRKAQGFGGLDRHYQGQGVLPQTHTHTYADDPQTQKSPRAPLVWLYRGKRNGPPNTIR